MNITKKKTGSSISKSLDKQTAHNLCNPEEWYTRVDIMHKLEDINPLYLMSDQTFFKWIRDFYKGTFKKQGLTTYYQGIHLNPVLDAIIAFKERYIKEK